MKRALLVVAAGGVALIGASVWGALRLIVEMDRAEQDLYGI